MVSISVSAVTGSTMENHWSSAAAAAEEGVEGSDVEDVGAVELSFDTGACDSSMARRCCSLSSYLSSCTLRHRFCISRASSRNFRTSSVRLSCLASSSAMATSTCAMLKSVSALLGSRSKAYRWDMSAASRTPMRGASMWRTSTGCVATSSSTRAL